MKTHPLKDDATGFQFGFEIENAYIGINRIINLLSGIKNISNIKRRRLFDSGNEYHIKFDYFGSKFVVLEPFGDSSVYWIVPETQEDGVLPKLDISEIDAAFNLYDPPFLIKLFGDIITLQLFRSRGEL